MTGVVIVGGAGTRLRPLTYLRPKAMMPLANKPLLQYHVELLRRHGVSDVVFCCGADTAAIRSHFGTGEQFGVGIAYSVESRPLGTAGAVRCAEPHFQHDTLIVMNGDSLMDYDLSAAVRFHHERKADVTIGLAEVPRPTPCGVVKTDSQGRVLSFEEPDTETKRMLAGKNDAGKGSAIVNSGVYVISRSALHIIPFGVECSIEKEFFPSVISGGSRVYGFHMSGYWLDIGDPARYLQAHHDLLAGKVDAEVCGERTRDGYWTVGEARIDPTAEVTPGAHLAAGCGIGPGVRIAGLASIGTGCTIGARSVLDGCVLLENVSVGEDCLLRRCIVDRDTRIGDGVRLTDQSVVGGGSTIVATR